MKTSIAAIFSVGAALVSTAAAQLPGGYFYLQVFREGTQFHQDRVSAALQNLFVNLPLDLQNATCEGARDSGFATFYLDGTRLNLLTFDGQEQLVFTDRSGFGRGAVGYLNSAEIPPRFEVDGWHLDANRDLHFKGENLIACIGAPHGSYGLRLGEPNKECVGIRVHAHNERHPAVCHYN